MSDNCYLEGMLFLEQLRGRYVRKICLLLLIYFVPFVNVGYEDRFRFNFVRSSKMEDFYG